MWDVNSRRVGIMLALAVALAAPLLSGCGRSGGSAARPPMRYAPGGRQVSAPVRPGGPGLPSPPTYTPSRPTTRMCFGCRGTGSVGPFGNPYSGAGYRPATSCSSCGGSGQVRN